MPGADIYDPDLYLDGPPHDVFDELRRTDPVHWQDMPDGTGYWAVLRHSDVVSVARDPATYSASAGGVMLEDLASEQLEMMRHMLLAMDPPVHDDHRRPLAPHFGAREIARMEDQIRAICVDVLEAAAEKGEVDFVHDVAAGLPSQVVGELMGLPPEDWPQIHSWAERQTSTQDAEVYGADAGNASLEMAVYAMELAAARRAGDLGDDLTALILSTDFGDGPMDDGDFAAFFVQLVTAGNDTTKTMLSSGTLALIDHPDQLAELRADASLLPGAVEEILRWANPLHYFRRTATVDTELGGTAVAAGQKVGMIYTAANRDPSVFDDPHRFDIHRHPNPHLSFGIGGHFCLGAHLARLEGRIFFEELLRRFRVIEKAGEPRHIRSNLNNGYKYAPVSLRAA